MVDVDKMLNLAIDVAKQAGERLQKISQRTINSQEGHDVKLQEDIESEKFIGSLLEKSGIPIIGEELSGNLSLAENNEYYWIVDPIDGTYNFLRGYPVVCVSIALMKGMDSIVGVVYDFIRDELFAGAKSHPLTINGVAIKPNWAKEKSQAMLMTGFPSATTFEDEAMQEFVTCVRSYKKVRMCGSAAIAAAYVACGRADTYFENKTNLWDVAAGMALAESAGAYLFVENANIAGKPLSLNIKISADKNFL
ncbi:MAG: inositol monophosphatase family protein [Opitutales bacterium]